MNNQCNSSINHVHRSQKAMLSDAISNLHGRIAFLTREARRSPENLRSVPGHHHSWFLKICADICCKEARESSIRLDRKLKNLVDKQKKPDTSNSRGTAPARINNVSSHAFLKKLLTCLAKVESLPSRERLTIKPYERLKWGWRKWRIHCAGRSRLMLIRRSPPYHHYQLNC